MKRALTDLETMRAQELLVQRATEGLDADAAAELARLGAADVDSFDLAAAAVAVAVVPREQLPAALAAQILAAAPGGSPAAAAPTSVSSTAPAVPTVAADLPSPREQVRRPTAARPSAPPRRGRAAWGVAAAGWLAAAALAAVALTRGPRRAPAAAPTVASPAIARQALIETSPPEAIVRRPLRAADGGPIGDVVWSATSQRGYVRLERLPPNDPRSARYQVWIVDRTRDARFPVDGGRFDVTAGGAQVVALAPSLPIGDATEFLITLEDPAGVVVSTRARLIATTAP